MRHGFLLIKKPEGPTSHDVVQQVRKLLHERSIGHLGTLDPLAQGLLVFVIGRKALKTVPLFAQTNKVYEARITFGKVSSTYDREGIVEEVPERKGWTPPTGRKLQLLLQEHFLGTIQQIPPHASAVHVDGKRAYEFVRSMLNDPLPPLPPRTVTISRIQLISYSYPEACLSIECSAGTYIRSLAHDLGQILRTGAYLQSLLRTRVGRWRLEDAVVPERATWTDVLPLKEVLQDFPRCELTEGTWEHVRCGRSISHEVLVEPTVAWFGELPVAILERDQHDPHMAHPRKVF